MGKNKIKLGVMTEEGASHVIVVAPNSNLVAYFPSHSTPTPSPSSQNTYMPLPTLRTLHSQQVSKAILSNVFTIWESLFHLVGEDTNTNNDG